MLKAVLPVLSGWGARAGVVVCSFVNTRLLIDVLGVNSYAALSIVLSLAPWAALLNLGLPNTTQNLIAQRRAQGRDAKRLQQAAVDAACTGTLLYLPAVLLLSLPVQRWLLQDHGSMSYASVMLVVWGLTMMGLGMVFNQVLHATHRSTWPVVMPALQAVLTTLALLAVVKAPSMRELWGTLAVTLPMLVVFLVSARLAGARLRWTLDWRALRTLLHTSRGFLLFSIAGALALSCDYIVMARLLGSQEVAQYNLAGKLFGTLLTLHGILLATSWTPLSDRFFRTDFAGMRSLLTRLLLMGFALLAIVGLPLSLFMDEVVRVLSRQQVQPLPLALVMGWLAYMLVRIWSDTFATALLSCNQLGTVNRYVVWQSVISLAAQWWLGARYGATGIVLGIVCSFVLTAAWILPMRFFRITRSMPRFSCHAA